MCGALLDDWVNGGSADDFFVNGEYAFCPKETWCYSRQWVWNYDKIILRCFKEAKCYQGFTTGI